MKGTGHDITEQGEHLGRGLVDIEPMSRITSDGRGCSLHLTLPRSGASFGSFVQ